MHAHEAPGARRPVSAVHLAIVGSRGIPARYGGFETFAEELAVRLVARGHEVTVYCEPPRGVARRSDWPSEHRGVRLEYVRVPALGALRALVYDLLALRRARARHEVVYLLGYGAGAFLGLARRPGNQVWVNMDGREWRRQKWGLVARAWLRRMESAALRGAERVIFDNAAVCREVLGGRPEARALVIEYGAELGLENDPAVLESLGLAPQSYYLLVARIEPENHVLEILRGHARSGSARALLVVGDLERARRYGRACRAAAGGEVRFLGAVFDRPTLHALRFGAAAVLHGHSVGGTNPALLEAMAAGTPVIAHENPYNREVLGEHALYFRDAEGLARALHTSERWSAAERAELGARLRARVEERYSWERIADEYARLLEATRGGAPEVRAAGATENEAAVNSAAPVPAALPARSARVSGTPVETRE